MHSEFTATEK